MFHGIQPRRYRDVLDCLHASVHQYPRNTHLVELGEQSHNTGILLDGTVEEFLYLQALSSYFILVSFLPYGTLTVVCRAFL